MSGNGTKYDTDAKLQVMGSVSVKFVSTNENTRYDHVQIERGDKGPPLKITKQCRFF